MKKSLLRTGQVDRESGTRIANTKTLDLLKWFSPVSLASHWNRQKNPETGCTIWSTLSER